nr:ABC transporter permease [Jannaschia sp. S6380]
MTLREMQARYGRSPGGYVWAILEPLGMIVLLAFGFSLLLRQPSLGDSFLLFYATAFLPFNLFSRVQLTVSSALTYSRNLLVYPVVSWLDAVAARIVLNTLTGVLIATLLLGGIIILQDIHTRIDMAIVIAVYATIVALGAGMAMVNAVIAAYFPIWKTIWNIATRPLFLASGIIYLFEELPRVAQDVLWWNPLIHLTAAMRAGFYPTYDPQFVSPVFLAVVTLGLLFFGLLLMRRFNAKVLEK